ncbi:MAG: hypothetical protein LBB68_11305 [Treponema sp.]|jgi:hypothetical protein|nr:hypothetical protein [Treponema sp.]
MEEGRRKKDGLFCVTNPKTIAIIQKNAARLFANADAAVFHLWPDPKSDTRWCSCPNCRAFSPEEQNRIAVNAAADALLKIKPRAQLSYYEPRDEMAVEGGPGEQNVPVEQDRVYRSQTEYVQDRLSYLMGIPGYSRKIICHLMSEAIRHLQILRFKVSQSHFPNVKFFTGTSYKKYSGRSLWRQLIGIGFTILSKSDFHNYVLYPFNKYNKYNDSHFFDT